jgi:hypothetical protein
LIFKEEKTAILTRVKVEKGTMPPLKRERKTTPFNKGKRLSTPAHRASWKRSLPALSVEGRSELQRFRLSFKWVFS